METSEPPQNSDNMKTSSNGSNLIQNTTGNEFNLWNYMTKEEKEKAKCKICSTILSRKNGATSGLRKHLQTMHKIQCQQRTMMKIRSVSQKLSIEKKKKLDSLIINGIIEDGRSFGDMRKAGILKVFNFIVPGKQN